MNSRKAFLFNNNVAWTKKRNADFDVTMGAYDGAEICDLVGLYILSKLEKVIPKDQIGLYRDDGLAVVHGSGPQLEKLRKNVFSLFKKLGLKVTIETNIKRCDFLDVYLDLESEVYKPFRKDNKKPVYIHKCSNHPTSIKMQLPSMISARLSSLSCNENVFLSEAPIYNDALKSAGYSEHLVYNKKSHKGPKTQRNRSRKVI